jgi:GntR family transcriptional regulator
VSDCKRGNDVIQVCCYYSILSPEGAAAETTASQPRARDDGEIGGSIDKTSPVPYYYQLRQLLERAVTSGALGVGQQIPTEAALCERFDVSRTVVRQTLSDLERQGLVTRIKGKGTFVAAPKLSEHLVQSLTSLHEDLTSRGERLETKVLRLEVQPVSPHVAELLRLPESEQIVLLERLRVVNGEPWVVTTAHMPHALCAPILELDMTHRSLFETYERELGFTLHRGSRAIEARVASGETAQQLGVPEGSPVLVFSGVTYIDDGRPLEYFVGIHRGDRSRFEVELFRPGAAARDGGPTWSAETGPQG